MHAQPGAVQGQVSCSGILCYNLQLWFVYTFAQVVLSQVSKGMQLTNVFAADAASFHRAGWASLQRQSRCMSRACPSAAPH
jgi:hypothetical protein